MKELSIEEKAKRYDETIDKAKKELDACGSQDCDAARQIFRLFSELKESEDEMIRKALVCHISKISTEIPVGALHRINGVDIPDILDWLEKQGNPIDINPSEFDLRLNKLLKQFETLPKEELASSLSFYLNVVQNDGTYREEKQGEQKPADKVEPKDYNGIDPHFGKPADKVEPKFQNGQWIVWQGKYYKVNDNGCGYELVDQNGLNTSLEYGTVDESAHVWDITKDAKDGDVLADNLGVILFKSMGDNNVINFHAYFSGLFAVQKDEENWGYAVNCTLSPATKEQRERFFAAMKEAGYEWDAEKKKLKKIEDEIEIPFGAKDSELQEATYFIPKGFHAEINGDKVVFKKGEKPTAWSEEDEKAINDIMWIIEAYRKDGFNETHIQMADNSEKWLKSLRPQKQWKPSDEQVEVLEALVEDNNQRYFYTTLNSLYEQLKKLREE